MMETADPVSSYVVIDWPLTIGLKAKHSSGVCRCSLLSLKCGPLRCPLRTRHYPMSGHWAGLIESVQLIQGLLIASFSADSSCLSFSSLPCTLRECNRSSASVADGFSIVASMW